MSAASNRRPGRTAALKQSIDDLTVAVRALTRVLTERRSPRTNGADSTMITDEDIPF